MSRLCPSDTIAFGADAHPFLRYITVPPKGLIFTIPSPPYAAIKSAAPVRPASAGQGVRGDNAWGVGGVAEFHCSVAAPPAARGPHLASSALLSRD